MPRQTRKASTRCSSHQCDAAFCVNNTTTKSLQETTKKQMQHTHVGRSGGIAQRGNHVRQRTCGPIERREMCAAPGRGRMRVAASMAQQVEKQQRFWREALGEDGRSEDQLAERWVQPSQRASKGWARDQRGALATPHGGANSKREKETQPRRDVHWAGGGRTTAAVTLPCARSYDGVRCRASCPRNAVTTPATNKRLVSHSTRDFMMNAQEYTTL